MQSLPKTSTSSTDYRGAKWARIFEVELKIYIFLFEGFWTYDGKSAFKAYYAMY